MEAIVAFAYKSNSKMYDLDVLKVYGALLKDFKAKLTNYPMSQHRFEKISEQLYSDLADHLKSFDEDYTIEEKQACVKQLEKSVKLWSREHGSRGYLNFIAQFNAY